MPVQKRRARVVCVCGHAMDDHTDQDGCRADFGHCPCTRFEWLDTLDTEEDPCD